MARGNKVIIIIIINAVLPHIQGTDAKFNINKLLI